jgi:mRNA interferase RelE/StbE
VHSGGGQVGRGVADSEYGGGMSDEGKPEPEAAAPAAPWSVPLSPTAIRALDHLPHKVAAAIAEFITATLPTDPHRLSKPLRYELSGWRRLPHHVPDPRRRPGTVHRRIEHRAHVYRRQ